MAEINRKQLDRYLEKYKDNLRLNGWKDPSFKLEAIKQFHDNWDIDIDAADFKDMLDRSLKKDSPLLDWTTIFKPRDKILQLAEINPECVRGMFKTLYDESLDFADRIVEFIHESDFNFKRYFEDLSNREAHQQAEDSVSVYLWLFKPDKYYIYRANVTNVIVYALGLDNQEFAFGSLKNVDDNTLKKQLRKYVELFDILRDEVCKDRELIELYDKVISENKDCYLDPEHVTLTFDFAYYMNSHLNIQDNRENLVRGPRFWWLNADPNIWKFSSMRVGDEETYTLRNESGYKRQIYKNFLDAREGDLVIGYESSPTQKVVALCKITQEQDGEKIGFTKTEDFKATIDYSELKSAPELKNMEFLKNSNGSLFKLEKDEYDFILNKIREKSIDPDDKVFDDETYDEKQFRSDVFMPGHEELIEVLKEKKNVILQGAPGVGKTYAARRIAYLMMGEKDDSRIGFVQFHQNYSYEDFIMGYKPCKDGFELKTGIFYDFCEKARKDSVNDYFFIIDEINRGNMSKIFGELLTLIEKDYRGTEVKLGYNGELFSVPENIYIIGMMNTADRSIAFIDYALRRRFSFFEIEPGFDSEGFKKYERELDSPMFSNLIGEIKKLNEDIEKDDSLGKGFKIGHSYFCNWEKGECTKAKMQRVVKYDILPMLDEYWFDNRDEYNKWENALERVVEYVAK